MHILSRKNSYGDPFTLLGIRFDCKLLMTDSVLELATSCRWKLKAILRTSRFNTGLDLVRLYKAQLLSFIEYRTAAIYHAGKYSLDTLGEIQNKLLRAAGMTSIDALNECHLAPLGSRRDIALLGLIHRSVLGRGPSHFQEFFRPDGAARQRGDRHRLQLVEFKDGHASDFALPGSRPPDYINNSILGLVAIYNALPACIVERCATVSDFQKSLQEVLVARANAGAADWMTSFSPRTPWHRHPIRSMW